MAESHPKPIRVRFAPSPTGPLHVGGVRTALFNWLFARQNDGKFILRIEDTDISRSEKIYEEGIIESFHWLGLNWDEGPDTEGKLGPYRQSERKSLYRKFLERLLGEERAYYCYCAKEELEAERQALIVQGLPPKYSGHCGSLKEAPAGPGLAGEKPTSIRFRTPDTKIEFKDLIRGRISFETGLFGDFIIAKNLDTPLFNFSGAVDDELMEISHVIRGEEHLSNTPKQILLRRALGFDEPIYAHIPLILNPDRSKLSKRFSETSIIKYRDEGYLPAAMINFLALLGWHPTNNQEIFSLDELIKEFDLKRVQKAGAIFNQDKLDWINSQHIKKLSAENLTEQLIPVLKKKNIDVPKKFVEKIVEAERDRLKKLGDFWDLAGFFFELPDYGDDLLIWQKEPASKIKKVLGDVLEIVQNIKPSEFNRENLGNALFPIMTEEGRGTVLWPLRVAVSGQAASPDPLQIVEILGAEETERRIKIAINKLEKHEQGLS